MRRRAVDFPQPEGPTRNEEFASQFVEVSPEENARLSVCLADFLETDSGHPALLFPRCSGPCPPRPQAPAGPQDLP